MNLVTFDPISSLKIRAVFSNSNEWQKYASRPVKNEDYGLLATVQDATGGKIIAFYDRLLF